MVARDVIADTADVLGVRPLHDLIDPSGEQMAADMQRTIYEGNQTPEENYALGRGSCATAQRSPTFAESARQTSR